MLLQKTVSKYFFLPYDAIHFVKYTNPSCSKAPLQHDAISPVPHSWNDVVWPVSITLFPPDVIHSLYSFMAKLCHFCFIRLEDIPPKCKIVRAMT